MAKDTDIKFGMPAHSKSSDITPKKFFCEKQAWPGSCDTLNLWPLNANTLRTCRAANFKTWPLCPRDSHDMTREKYFRKGNGQHRKPLC